MISLSVSIDVPSLADGVRFYSKAFGFAKVSEPIPGIVVIRNGDAELLLLEKEAGSKPSLDTRDTRRYERHWTPVHLDFAVADLKASIERALAAGATLDDPPETHAWGRIAHMADPFGHGFCLIER